MCSHDLRPACVAATTSASASSSSGCHFCQWFPPLLELPAAAAELPVAAAELPVAAAELPASAAVAA